MSEIQNRNVYKICKTDWVSMKKDSDVLVEQGFSHKAAMNAVWGKKKYAIKSDE